MKPEAFSVPSSGIRVGGGFGLQKPQIILIITPYHHHPHQHIQPSDILCLMQGTTPSLSHVAYVEILEQPSSLPTVHFWPSFHM